MRNLYEFYVEATGAPLSSGISVDYETGRVVWYQHIRASFFAEYDFRAFPFDRQALIIEFEPRAFNTQQQIVLVGSSIVYDERPLGISEDINGWHVEKATEDFLFWRTPSQDDSGSIKC